MGKEECQVIAVEIGKGGSGKTTTVVNTAAILAEQGKKVCVIDADASQNATKRSGVVPQDYRGYSLFEILKEECNIKDCIIKTKFGYDLVPSIEDLCEIDVVLLMNRDKYPDPMHILKNAIDKIRGEYDYIILDTPPTISFNTITTLLAADAVIIPMQCEEDAWEGSKSIIKAIYKYAPEIEILGILPTMFFRGTNTSTTTLSRARRFYEGKVKVFDTTIYRTTKFPEADSFKQPAVVYSDHENIQEYRAFVKEVFKID